MSGLIGKAMRFAKTKQGKAAIEKVSDYASSPAGKQRIEGLKEKVEDLRGGGGDEPVAKPKAAPKPPAEQAKPDPNAPA